MRVGTGLTAKPLGQVADSVTSRQATLEHSCVVVVPGDPHGKHHEGGVSVVPLGAGGHWAV